MFDADVELHIKGINIDWNKIDSRSIITVNPMVRAFLLWHRVISKGMPSQEQCMI